MVELRQTADEALGKGKALVKKTVGEFFYTSK